MCGIVGILDLSTGRPVQPDEVAGMCDRIVHRGPDDVGIHTEGGLGLGMRRLSIIDVASGKQPIPNEDETVWIVFNGEIYNHLALREKLIAAGHVFRTGADTETILHLYEEEGLDCLQHLRGMFAFAIWDRPRRRLVVARDRLGIKPLFWSRSGGRLSFASEMKAVTPLPGIDLDIDWDGFDAFFTYNYIPAPLTIYRGIHKLPPAHYMVVENGELSLHRYWDVSFADKHTGTEEQIRDEFLALMSDAVGMRLMSEVPLGSFLSGGIDSGMVVAMMGQASPDPVRTFTMGFGGEVGNFLDERPFAREIAERYGCLHREAEVLPRIDEALDAGLTSFDEPFADDSLIPTYHICEEAAKEVTVVLTGLGGDENFAGYERYLGFWLSRFYEKIPYFMRDKLIRPLVMNLREESGGHYRINHLKRFVKAGGLPAARRYQSYLRSMSPEQRRRLYAPEVAEQVDFERVEFLGREHFERLPEGDFLDRALYQDLNMYLPEDILALSDRIGMHHSLELRVPFVDHEVVEFCARIPSHMKLKGRSKKHLLKEAATSLVPPSVIAHRKQGFCSPMAAWLRGDLKPTLESCLSSEALTTGGIFQVDAVAHLMESHQSLRQMNDKVLFSLLVFQKWFARYGAS